MLTDIILGLRGFVARLVGGYREKEKDGPGIWMIPKDWNRSSLSMTCLNIDPLQRALSRNNYYYVLH